jgi:formate hydrogenlyase subunit 3/multisubunit Na+/H+ antiporter MnhD subunit
VIRAVAWLATFAAAWLAFVWLAAGAWALPALFLAALVERWQRRRHGAPEPVVGSPVDYPMLAIRVLGVLVACVVFGYGPDWLVASLLGAALVFRLLEWRDAYRRRHA